jgi:arginyl-tRNA synthetase
MVWKVCEMAGWLVPPTEAIHVAFGNVLGDDRKMLRSRSGDSVKLVDLLDEAIDRADAAIAEKNPDLDGPQRAEVARMIGIGAVKYADLSTDRVKDYVFDLDRMVSFDGNTGPYLQYAHARICSIFRRAGIDRASVRGLPITLDAPQERALALRLLAYPTAIDTDARDLQPAQAVHLRLRPGDRLHRVLRALPGAQGRRAAALEPPRPRDLTARTLAHALGLLGIDAPEQM